MGTEIERKFLVGSDGWRDGADGGTEIRQGYLSRPPSTEVRVRRSAKGSFLTVKSGRGKVRSEHEWSIADRDADELLALCQPAVIEKVRYKVPRSEVVWEVDVFGGRHAGLVVAEVELESPDQDLDIPDWVAREVTGNGAYGNVALSTQGVPAGGPPVYVASPLGFSEPGRRYNHEVLLPAMRAAGLQPLDPWDGPDDPIGRAVASGDRDAIAAANREVGGRNAALIRSSAGLLAVLDGTDVDSGTAAEIGFAAALGIPIVGVRTDIRLAGDNAVTLVNLQVEWFVTTTGGSLHVDLGEALQSLGRLVGATT